MPSADLLRPDNHELFNHMRLMLIARDPIYTLEEIAEEFGGVPVPDLIAWFLSYRLPPAARVRPAGMTPRDPALRAELGRLRDREASLVTVASEAPRELIKIQQRIDRLERTR